jgi:hypothetical protein
MNLVERLEHWLYQSLWRHLWNGITSWAENIMIFMSHLNVHQITEVVPKGQWIGKTVMLVRQPSSPGTLVIAQ